MTASHTPGPWLIHDKCTLHMNDAEIATVGRWEKIVTHEHVVGRIDAHMNATLIAAAPDLLAACEDAFVAMGGLDFNDSAAAAWGRLLDAIRKARGIL